MSDWIAIMNDEIEQITPPNFPYLMEEKIFTPTDEEGNAIGENYSYNDWLKKIEDISGINYDLLGKKNDN